MSRSLARHLPLLLVPLLALLTGCVPGVGWLPDSSGFVYTGGKGGKQLLLFDVKKKATRVLADGVGPAWPAVSPDGKRVAVACRHKDGEGLIVTVSVFDLTGKRLHRSKGLAWGASDRDEPRHPVETVCWGPAGDRLLLSGPEKTGIYDLKTGRVTPVEGFLSGFGPGLARPDGKGFITASAWGLHFVDWDGKPRPIKGRPSKLLTADCLEHRVLLLIGPHVCNSGWDGPVAHVSFHEDRFRIDTRRLVAFADEMKPALTADRRAVRQAVDLAGGVRVRVTHPAPGRDGYPADFRKGRLEVVRPGGKVRVLVRGVEAVVLYPSPDRKWVAVRWASSLSDLYGGKDGEDFLLLDAQGNVVADRKVAK
jgi:hypothetical protein